MEKVQQYFRIGRPRNPAILARRQGDTNEQEEKYGIVFNYNESDNSQVSSIVKGCEILSNSKLNSKNMKNLLKINFTNF